MKNEGNQRKLHGLVQQWRKWFEYSKKSKKSILNKRNIESFVPALLCTHTYFEILYAKASWE